MASEHNDPMPEIVPTLLSPVGSARQPRRMPVLQPPDATSPSPCECPGETPPSTALGVWRCAWCGLVIEAKEAGDGE